MKGSTQIYIDQEADGMYLLHSDQTKPYKISHSAFITGEWLPELVSQSDRNIDLIIERAHTVGAVKSPAQRFTDEEWSAFYENCRKVSARGPVRVAVFAWPERVTSNARRFVYGDAGKAKKESGVHDLKAMKTFHVSRPHLGLMRLDKPSHNISDEMAAAIADHRAEMNYELLFLKNRNYLQGQSASHPWMDQVAEVLPRLAKRMTEEQRKILDVKFYVKNADKITTGWNRPRVVTLWALTHNLDGTIRRDNAGRPISGRYLKNIISFSPYRPRRSGVHRANIMHSARPAYIKQKIKQEPEYGYLLTGGTFTMKSLTTVEDVKIFTGLRNQFDKEWLQLAKIFRDYSDA